MGSRIGIRALRQSLSQTIHRVEAGETVEVRVTGKLLARASVTRVSLYC